MKTGKFIVIEGTDGSGKGTHTEQLVTWLKTRHPDVETFDFPQYGAGSAYFVEKYLRGDYGGISEVGPYRGSLFYALDRYDAGFRIRAALDRGAIVVSNRYVGSNMGHQGSKIHSAQKRRQYFEWNSHLEFELLGIPRPDLNIVLRMPAEQAQKFVDQKAARSYTQGRKRDLHEADLDHLKRAEQTYIELCQLFPKTFTLIDCEQDGRILSLDEVQTQIRVVIES